MAEGELPDGIDPATPVIKAHYALASGRESFAVVAIEVADGVPVLPFVALEGIVFLREIGGELVNLANIHRIEGLPEPARSGD